MGLDESGSHSSFSEQPHSMTLQMAAEQVSSRMPRAKRRHASVFRLGNDIDQTGLATDRLIPGSQQLNERNGNITAKGGGDRIEDCDCFLQGAGLIWITLRWKQFCSRRNDPTASVNHLGSVHLKGVVAITRKTCHIAVNRIVRTRIVGKLGHHLEGLAYLNRGWTGQVHLDGIRGQGQG